MNGEFTLCQSFFVLASDTFIRNKDTLNNRIKKFDVLRFFFLKNGSFLNLAFLSHVLLLHTGLLLLNITLRGI